MNDGESEPDVILSGPAGKIYLLTTDVVARKQAEAEARMWSDILEDGVVVNESTGDAYIKAMETQDLAIYQLFWIQGGALGIDLKTSGAETLTGVTTEAIRVARHELIDSIAKQIQEIPDAARRAQFTDSAIVDLLLDTFDDQATRLLKTTAFREVLMQRRYEALRGNYISRAETQPATHLAVRVTQPRERGERWHYFTQVDGVICETKAAETYARPRTDADIRALTSQGFDVIGFPLQELLNMSTMVDCVVLRHYEDPELALYEKELQTPEL